MMTAAIILAVVSSVLCVISTLLYRRNDRRIREILDREQAIQRQKEIDGQVRGFFQQ